MATSSKAKTPEPEGRAALLRTVKTPLGFFALVVLAVEVMLAALAAMSAGFDRTLALAGMLLIVAALVVVVALLAYLRPEALRGTRPKPSGDGALAAFCARIQGPWWERVSPAIPSAISFVEMLPDAATTGIKLRGSAYDNEGQLAAHWESLACCINLSEAKLFYYWRGWHPQRPNEPFEGFGEIVFQPASGLLQRAHGFFSDTNLTDLKSTTRKAIEFRRASAQDLQQIREGREVAALVRQRLA
jgi:hypothetical protein